MFRILKKSLKTGVVTGQHPKADAPREPASPEAVQKTKPFTLARHPRSGHGLLQCLRDGDECAGESGLRR